MHNSTVEMTEYGGFVSYGVKPIATSKPGITNYYVKDAYKDISNYNKRRVEYYEDKIRWNSVYDKDIIKAINEKDYHASNRSKFKSELDKYEYMHDPNIIHSDKQEENVRTRFEESKESINRKKMFSNWETTYDNSNRITNHLKTQFNFGRPEIEDLFKNKYHNYQHGRYKTEHTHNYGVHGDQPFEKFFDKSQGKLYLDNYEIAKGTTKTTNIIPGYSGFIPSDSRTLRSISNNDPYSKTGKTNHMLNYNVRLTGYSGYKPIHPNNIKGNSRPYCLSTEGETFS